MAQNGCDRMGDVLGWVKGTSYSQRIALMLACGRNVQGPGALALLAALWIVLKGLAIPGSMILCVALGGLMSDRLVEAQIIATACEVAGGALCYAVSGFIGRPLLEWLMPSVLKRFSDETEARKAKGDLFYFALFVRMTPLVPNWFVNAASNIVGVPFRIFIVALVIGVQIATFLSIRTGALLSELGTEYLKGSDDVILNGHVLKNFLILLVAQFIALIPVYWSKKGMPKFKDE